MDEKFPMRLKDNCHRSVVGLTMLNGSKCWEENGKKNWVNIANIKMLRRMRGLTIEDRNGFENVRGSFGFCFQ